ncbi:M14 family metallocarboxypeptidase [Puniceicoccales bacterium CK1056]|uniref:M14 family metallocarboxypeptidase n=1 Tax=Oceanipulchritudo coccoides TaxID=2706888 RepID=A0A6B2M297_9BACT|nr:M14 family metallocarboxypeptidase [Oceanipulchritudo coccoides]
MNVEVYSERLEVAAKRAGFSVLSYGKVGDFSLPVLKRDVSDTAPSVYISAGVHGNEPAGPMAVLDMLRRKAFPEYANLTVFPLINPEGLLAGTRENAAGIDLNRDYGLSPRSVETKAQLEWIGQRSFDFVICLHEDDDGQGFYIYAHVDADTELDYEGIALKAAEPWTGIDQRELIDDMPAENGRMRPPEEVMDAFGNDLPEALRLHFHHSSKYTFTTETPSRQPIDKRIRAQCAVVEAVLAAWCNEQQPDPIA